MRSFVQSLTSHRRGNIAHEEGGAIKILAMASSTLRVEGSLFDSNAVRVQAGGGGEEAIASGKISAEDYDRIVQPRTMIGDGLAGA